MSSEAESIWDILGLPEDCADSKALKKAYARKVRTVRPDEDAEAFMALRAAYDAARNIVRYREQISVARGEDPESGPMPALVVREGADKAPLADDRATTEGAEASSDRDLQDGDAQNVDGQNVDGQTGPDRSGPGAAPVDMAFEDSEEPSGSDPRSASQAPRSGWEDARQDPLIDRLIEDENWRIEMKPADLEREFVRLLHARGSNRPDWEHLTDAFASFTSEEQDELRRRLLVHLLEESGYRGRKKSIVPPAGWSGPAIDAVKAVAPGRMAKFVQPEQALWLEHLLQRPVAPAGQTGANAGNNGQGGFGGFWKWVLGLLFVAVIINGAVNDRAGSSRQEKRQQEQTVLDPLADPKRAYTHSTYSGVRAAWQNHSTGRYCDPSPFTFSPCVSQGDLLTKYKAKARTLNMPLLVFLGDEDCQDCEVLARCLTWPGLIDPVDGSCPWGQELARQVHSKFLVLFLNVSPDAWGAVDLAEITGTGTARIPALQVWSPSGVVLGRIDLAPRPDDMFQGLPSGGSGQASPDAAQFTPAPARPSGSGGTAGPDQGADQGLSMEELLQALDTLLLTMGARRGGQ